MFIKGSDKTTRLPLYRDVFATYKKLIEGVAEEYSLPKDCVMVRTTSVNTPNRAPLIVIQRGDMQHTPRSLMLNERQYAMLPQTGIEYDTKHIIDYFVEFVSYGNEYLEAERLGNLCLETLLTTGMSVMRRQHPNFLGAELIGWSKTELAEGPDSSLLSNTVIGRVTLQIDGIYQIKNK